MVPGAKAPGNEARNICQTKEKWKMNTIPQDPLMLLSYINTQLRDNYASLDELCAALGIEKETLQERLRAVNYEYDSEKNTFW